MHLLGQAPEGCLAAPDTAQSHSRKCLFFTMSSSLGLPSTDVSTSSGKVVSVVTIGHASLLFAFQGRHIYVDPWSQMADYSKLPKADALLITHDHFDHLDLNAIKAISTPTTILISNAGAGSKLSNPIILQNGDSRDFPGFFSVRAVPAYNQPKRVKFHPKGRDNGYVLTIDGTTFYVAGDTEPQKEILELKVDVAFLPVNQPYTMTIEQAIETVKAIKPRIFYPYHYSDTDVSRLKAKLAKEVPETEVRLPPQKTNS
jgi:L-ascorbate metabolism protein UlaG (beta-lactamase superfamily)